MLLFRYDKWLGIDMYLILFYKIGSEICYSFLVENIR